MNTVDMWKVLEIEPTKDEETIVNAYRAKVVTVNPEDDAEGFMLLRQAFEMAMNFAREDDALEDGDELEEEPQDKTEIDLHIDKVRAIYEDLEKRRDISLWEEWANDPLSIELDTTDQVREALLVFIMGHFMLPSEVWKLLDKTFSIVSDRAALQEIFPPDFIAFVIFHIENEGFVDYSYIEKREGYAERNGCTIPEVHFETKPGIFDPEKYETEIDSYLRYLGFVQSYNNNIRMYEMEDGKNAVDDTLSDEEAEEVKKRAVEEAKVKREKELEVFASVLEYLNSFPYFHPIQIAGEIYLLNYLGRYDEARGLAEEIILGHHFEEKNYAIGSAAYILLMDTILRPEATSEEEKQRIYEESRHYVDSVIEEIPENSVSLLARAVLELIEGRYEDSNDTVISVLDTNSRISEAVWLLKEINRRTIDFFEKKFEAGELSDKEKVDFAWAYFRVEDVDNVFRILDQTEPNDECIYGYNNLYGRCYHIKKKYKEALPYLAKWVDMLEVLIADNESGKELSKKDRERVNRRAFCYYMYASCLEELGSYEDADSFYKKAIDTTGLNTGEPNEKLFYQESYGKMLTKMGRHEDAMNIWDEMIASIDHCVPAYIHRQETAYEIKNAQLVIDDYYNITRDLPQYENAYVLAAKVFYIYNQIEDVKSVLKRAEEAGIKSDRLRIFEAKLLDGEGKWDEARQLFAKIEENIDSGESDVKDLADFYADIASMLINKREKNGERKYLYEVEKYLKKGFKNNPKSLRLLWIKTDLEEFRGNEADTVYDEMLGFYPNDSQIYYEYGEYLKRAEKHEKAITMYKKCLELNPKHKSANNRIMTILEQEYTERERREDYEEAVRYATAQLEIIDDDYYRIERALMYLDGYELEKAREDAEKAIEFRADNTYAHNALGLYFLKSRRYTDALDCFKKAIEVMEEGETPTPFLNASRCCESVGDFNGAIEYMKMCIEKFGDSINRKSILARLYMKNRQYQSADKIYIELNEYYVKQRKETQNKWYDSSIIKNLIKRVGLAHLSGDEAAASARIDEINHFLRHNLYMEKSLDNLSKGNVRKVNADLFRALADFYLHDERNYKLAISYYEKVIRYSMPNSLPGAMPSLLDLKNKLLGAGKKQRRLKLERPELLAKDTAKLREFAEMYGFFANACYAFGLKEAAVELTERAFDCFRRAYGDVENYLAYPQAAPLRICDYGMLLFFLGKQEEAFKFVEQSCELMPCDFCNYDRCYDKILTQARMAELSGDIPRAIELYKQARSITNNDVEIYMALRALAGKVE